MLKHRAVWTLIMVLAFVGICKQEASAEQQIATIARAVSNEVGHVGQTDKGSRGVPVIVLEERHNSRAGQIQHAITLVRLYDNHALRDIALEGYLREDPTITTDWYDRAAKGDSIAKTQVAVRLLKEGEISSAEFMALAYEDVQLHPVETRAEYEVEIDTSASRAPILYLLKIAQGSVQEKHYAHLIDLQEKIKNAKNEEERQKYGAELIEYVMSLDPWTQKMYKASQEEIGASTTAEAQLARMQEIEQQARSRKVDLDPEEVEAMKRNIAFWRGRANASTTMVDYTGGIADRPGVPLVAMMIGAAHTDGIIGMLRGANRPFAVITPRSLQQGDEHGDIDWGMFERKYESMSIYSDDFTTSLLDAFPVVHEKKPKPVIPQPWFQVKSRLYLYVHRISERILGPPAPPIPPEDGPPWGFADDEFSDRDAWLYIDPQQIEVVQANPNERRFRITEQTILYLAMADVPDEILENLKSIQGRSETSNAFLALLRTTIGEDQTEQYGSLIMRYTEERAVLFPVILNPNDPSKRTEKWIKAGLNARLGFPTLASTERANTEAMLRKALEEVQAERPQEVGRLDFSLESVGVVADSRKEALESSI